MAHAPCIVWCAVDSEDGFELRAALAFAGEGPACGDEQQASHSSGLEEDNSRLEEDDGDYNGVAENETTVRAAQKCKARTSKDIAHLAVSVRTQHHCAPRTLFRPLASGPSAWTCVRVWGRPVRNKQLHSRT